MSQTKIISLKAPDGKILASIVPMRDGRWLEIKCFGRFQKKKRVFETEEKWLRICQYEYVSYEIVRNQRETYESTLKQWEQNPIESDFKDGKYLDELAKKYRIKYEDPVKKIDLLRKEEIRNASISSLKAALEDTSNKYNEKEKAEFSVSLARNERELSEIQEQIRSIGLANIKMEYEPLDRRMSIAYIQTKDNLNAIGYDSKEEKIVYDGVGYNTFAECQLPERPLLWIVKRNQLIRPI